MRFFLYSFPSSSSTAATVKKKNSPIFLRGIGTPSDHHLQDVMGMGGDCGELYEAEWTSSLLQR
jgi:hypothetical protein